MKTHETLSYSLALCGLWLGACGAPVDAPSAFEAEHFLCDAARASEFDARLEACRQKRLVSPALCSGFLSFRGVIDSQPVVLDAEIVTATYTDDHMSTGVARTFVLRAYSPYFLFRLDTLFLVDPNTGDILAPYLNSAIPYIVNLEARGANYFSVMVSPTVTVQRTVAGELTVALSGRLARGGSLEACLDFFPIFAR